MSEFDPAIRKCMKEQRDETDSERLPDWLNMHQALAWVSFRDVELTSRSDPDALMAEHLWPSMERLAGRADLSLALQDKRLVAQGARRGEDWEEVPSAQWVLLDVAPRDPSRQKPYEMIRVARIDLLRAFPPRKTARASYVENVDWCAKWIASGNGNGMDKAWQSFTLKPQNKGISRDSFRLAWNEAKGRKSG